MNWSSLMDGLASFLAVTLQWINNNTVFAALGAAVALLNGVIAVCLLIPGDQPEKALQAAVDFLAKLSKK